MGYFLKKSSINTSNPTIIILYSCHSIFCESINRMLNELKIDRSSSKPISTQISLFVRGKIQRNELKPGDRLPSNQELREKLGVGTITIREAIADLEKDGLVTSRPRVGTIISDGTAVLANGTENSNGNIKTRHIAVIGLFGHIEGDRFRFRPETTEGIMRECQRLGASATLLPNNFAEKNKLQTLHQLKSMGCKGLIWAINSVNFGIIDHLIANGIPVVGSRRQRVTDGRPYVESDYDGAGCDAGHYFYACGCGQIDIFSYFSLDCGHDEATANKYPLGIKHGVVRALEMQGCDVRVNYHVNKSEGAATSKAIFEKIATLPTLSGLLFTNGYHLLELLKEYGDPVRSLLDGRKIVTISNKTINLQLEHYVDGIDLMVLVDPYEEIGRLMVGKLIGMIDGYYSEGTTTLVNTKLMSFKEALEV